MSLTPSEVVKELDNYIIGQDASKKAVAIALRNRWRRLQLSPEIAEEIYPKNILMIGPTGVGKTEISRRIAKLIDAPFIKVEATKFTEVGYVGRDVESIIRHLAEDAMRQLKKNEQKKNKQKIEDVVEERLLNILVPPQKDGANSEENRKDALQLMRKKLREGDLEDKSIQIKMKPSLQMGMQVSGQHNMEEIMGNLEKILKPMQADKTQKMPLKEVRRLFKNDVAEDLMGQVDLRSRAVKLVESSGIVFIDEIDKIVRVGEASGDVSREGVQRDLLPIIEGSQVKTKIGFINTDHILFIASGAFHKCKPSDLIPELQGRLPVRVELQKLSIEDFKRILLEPKCSLIKQYQQLLAVDKVILKFTDSAISALAETAFKMNQQIENIGARRLHTILERLLEDISFHIPEQNIEVEITDTMVHNALASHLEEPDLSKFVL